MNLEQREVTVDLCGHIQPWFLFSWSWIEVGSSNKRTDIAEHYSVREETKQTRNFHPGRKRAKILGVKKAKKVEVA